MEKRPEQVEKVREKLKLELTFNNSRCKWCDFKVEGKLKRKLDNPTPKFDKTEWKFKPLTLKD